MVRRGAEAAWRVDWPGAEWEFASLTAEDREWYGRVAEAVLGEASPTPDDMEDAATPRPLTPDAITDEMVERARSAYWGPTYCGSVDERVRAILTAALTEPPARPEGAEKIDGIVEDWMNTLDEDPALGEADDRGSLADFLAEHGVRVVTEEKP